MKYKNKNFHNEAPTRMLIISKYSGKCDKCLESYTIGSKVWWNRKTKKVLHLLCIEKTPLG